MGLTERHWFENEEPELTERQLEDIVYENKRAYDSGYVKGFHDAKTMEEQRKGHWIVLEYCANEGIYCSECHTKIFDFITKPKKKLSQYCPHCGSRNEQFFRDGEVVFR